MQPDLSVLLMFTRIQWTHAHMRNLSCSHGIRRQAEGFLKRPGGYDMHRKPVIRWTYSVWFAMVSSRLVSNSPHQKGRSAGGQTSIDSSIAENMSELLNNLNHPVRTRIWIFWMLIVHLNVDVLRILAFHILMISWKSSISEHLEAQLYPLPIISILFS